MMLVMKDVRDTYFAIYDRWGARVFETDVFRTGWDGIISDKDASSGVYFYIFRYKCNLSNEEVIMKGDVTLVR